MEFGPLPNRLLLSRDSKKERLNRETKRMIGRTLEPTASRGWAPFTGNTELNFCRESGKGEKTRSREIDFDLFNHFIHPTRGMVFYSDILSFARVAGTLICSRRKFPGPIARSLVDGM